jgi:hypothetical protein
LNLRPFGFRQKQHQSTSVAIGRRGRWIMLWMEAVGGFPSGQSCPMLRALERRKRTGDGPADRRARSVDKGTPGQRSVSISGDLLRPRQGSRIPASRAIQGWSSSCFLLAPPAAAGVFGAATTAAPSMGVAEGAKFAWAPTRHWGLPTPALRRPTSWPTSIKAVIPSL